MTHRPGSLCGFAGLALGALLASAGCTGARPLPQTCFHLNAAAETEIGYCRAVRTEHALYVSGTAADGPMPKAIRTVYERLKATLEANGLSLADVTKENVYATDLDAFIQNKAIRREFYGEAMPAATWVQVQRLYVPSLVVEVELTAEYPHRTEPRPTRP